MQVQAKLGGKAFWVEGKAIMMTTLLESKDENIGHFPAEDSPRHFNIAIRNNRNRGGDGGLSQRTAKSPTAEDVPLVDFGGALEFGELVFGRLGEFNAIDWGFHGAFEMNADECQSIVQKIASSDSRSFNENIDDLTNYSDKRGRIP